MTPVKDIPQLLKWAWEVLSVVDLVLKHLQEALAFGAGLWDSAWDGHYARNFRPSTSSLFRFPHFYFALRNGYKICVNIYIYIIILF
jgi:hypothetical protein